MIFHIHKNCFGRSLSGVFSVQHKDFCLRIPRKTELVGYVAVCHNPRRQRLTSIAHEVLSLRTHCCQQRVKPKIAPQTYITNKMVCQTSTGSALKLKFIIHISPSTSLQISPDLHPQEPFHVLRLCFFCRSSRKDKAANHAKPLPQLLITSLYQPQNIRSLSILFFLVHHIEIQRGFFCFAMA